MNIREILDSCSVDELREVTQWLHEHGGRCLDCGCEVPSRAKWCKPCRNAAASRRFTNGAAGEKRDRIAAMYREGLPGVEMAQREGMTPDALRVALHRMRTRHGYDLPYRRLGWSESSNDGVRAGVARREERKKANV